MSPPLPSGVNWRAQHERLRQDEVIRQEEACTFDSELWPQIEANLTRAAADLQLRDALKRRLLGESYGFFEDARWTVDSHSAKHTTAVWKLLVELENKVAELLTGTKPFSSKRLLTTRDFHITLPGHLVVAAGLLLLGSELDLVKEAGESLLVSWKAYAGTVSEGPWN